MTVVLNKEGCLEYVSGFLSDSSADTLLTDTVTSVEWEQPSILMFGKQVTIPRLQSWIGDAGTGYKYSGKYFEPKPWPDFLQSIKKRVSEHCRHDFNSVLINYYRDGQDSMGWHSDNEKELGKNPMIASLSIGAERRMDFIHKKSKDCESLWLENGSLLIMSGPIQKNWKHCIRKTKKVNSGRINFTFRKIQCE